jgi:hypothetical protein
LQQAKEKEKQKKEREKLRIIDFLTLSQAFF